jgi:hypothetical protein
MCAENARCDPRDQCPLAVFATPELQHAFADWITELEQKAVSALAGGEKIDLDPKMLDAAHAKVAATGVANCDFVEGDAYAVAELVRRPVDFVLIENTFLGRPGQIAPRAGRFDDPKARGILCCG